MGDAGEGLYFTSPTWPASGGAGGGTVGFGSRQIGSYSLLEMSGSTKLHRAWTAKAWLHLNGDLPTELGPVLYDGGDIDRALRVVVLEAIAVHFLEPVERGVGALVRGGQQPEAIVRALAEMDPAVLRDHEWGYHGCGCCDMPEVLTEDEQVLADPSRHEPDCPWRMAREWTAANAEIG